MRMFKDFGEIKSAVGTEVGVSNWVTITQERINRFAEATGDEQWIHVDVERAQKELPVRTTIAHGLLTGGSGGPSPSRTRISVFGRQKRNGILAVPLP
jgi:acyl dehydratase